jgi:hypothetical protein
MEPNVVLDLEVEEIERAGRPGCGGGGSSSTSPHCTCPVLVNEEE